MIDGSEIGRRIEAARKEAGLTLPEMADRASVSKGYLWTLETHWRNRADENSPNPGLDVLARIAAVLGFTVADLLREDQTMVSRAADETSKLPPGLSEFLDMRARQGEAVPNDLIPALRTLKLRGRKPRAVEEWAEIYRAVATIHLPPEQSE